MGYMSELDTVRSVMPATVRIDDNHLVIDYRYQEWLIEHFYFDEHIASVVKNDFDVEWTIVPTKK